LKLSDIKRKGERSKLKAFENMIEEKIKKQDL